MNDNNVKTAVTYGLIIGLVYSLLLFWRWSSTDSLIKFGLLAILGYFITLCFMFYEAYQIRKMNGGYIDLKSLFKALFISVLIFELFYSLYNYIHLTYIDPNVVDGMKAGIIEMFDKMGDKVRDEDREKSIKQIDDLKKATEVLQIIKSYLTSIAISGIFALIFSAILKKKKPVFQEIN